MNIAAHNLTPVPILMYHDIETRPRERKYKHFYVLASDFEWQMQSLKKAGYTPISFSELGDGIAGRTILPAKPIVLTFDDGYRNVLTLAHPILARNQMRYTVFIVTGKTGGQNDWVASEGYETSPLLTWNQILELRASGLADIQVHTVSHPRLSKLSANEIKYELQQCKETGEERLGSPIHTICYPYGDHNSAVVETARSVGYTYGVTTEFGRTRQGDDLLALPRISIHHVPPLSFDYGIASLNFWWKIKTRVDRRE